MVLVFLPHLLSHVLEENTAWSVLHIKFNKGQFTSIMGEINNS